MLWTDLPTSFNLGLGFYQPGWFPFLSIFFFFFGTVVFFFPVQGRSQKKIRTEAISMVEFPA